MPDVDQKIARLAANQHAVITRAQAFEHGATPSMVQRRLTHGRWTRVDAGVYLIAGAPVTWATRVHAACLASGGVASHRTAAVLWGLDGYRPGRPEVSIERGRSYRRADIRTHESTDLDLSSPRTIDGIPTTGADRLLVDLGAVVGWRRVEEAAFEAVNRRLVTWPDLWEALVLHARRGRRGVGALRAVLERDFGTAVPESRLEVIFERLIEDAGLPHLERQVTIHDAGGFVARVDFAYPALQAAFEVDGRSIHTRREAFDHDNERRNRILNAGWYLRVFTTEMILGKPVMVCEQVRHALRTRAAA